MIEEVNRRLQAWVSAVDETLEPAISFALPDGKSQRDIVSLYLFEVLPSKTGRPSKGEPPIHITLRYLVTAWGSEARKTHAFFSKLIFAAAEQKEWELESEPIAPHVWQSLGIPLRPAFVIRAVARKERPVRPVPKVTEEIVLHAKPFESLKGKLLYPGGKVVMGALVEVPEINLSTRTNALGEFVLNGLPCSDVTNLRVDLKGRKLTIPLLRSGNPGQPVIINLTEKEF